MAEQKAEFAMLTFDFLRLISEESALLSKRAEEFLEFSESSTLVAIIKPELIMAHITLRSLSESCKNALETCAIDDNKVVRVPAEQFLQIADASQIGMDAYKEAEKYISFSLH
mgnify:FL=1